MTAAILAAGLVLVGAGSGLARVGPDVRAVAAAATLGRVEARLGALRTARLGVEARAAEVGADLERLRAALAATERRLTGLERARQRRLRTASGLAEGEIPAAPPRTLAELRAPLALVTEAMYANDRLGVELVAERAEAARREGELRAWLGELREAAARLSAEERRARAGLAEAIGASAEVAALSDVPRIRERAEAVVAEAREELRLIAVAEAEVRARMREVLAELERLRAHLVGLREDLREVRRANAELERTMGVAELLVGAWLETFPGTVGEVEVALQGVLRVCPVDQPMSYSDNWHAPRWGGGFHLHEGIDIFAPLGTPVRAPFDGTAVVADNPLGGIAVKVLGASGYVYAAHLQERGALGQVRAGDVIGYVGATGNASGPHLHFEYHPLGGEAVNPFPFLNAVC